MILSLVFLLDVMWIWDGSFGMVLSVDETLVVECWNEWMDGLAV